MVKPTWLIESDVFGTSSEPIKSEVRSQGMALEVVHARPFLNGVIPRIAGKPLSNDDCVLFWGSPPLMHHIRLNYAWRPGGWCNFENLNCTEYYPRLRPWLLNRDCQIGTIDDLIHSADELFAKFASHGEVFVRPCTLEKVFTGQLVTIDNFAATLERARYANCLALVASPVPISCEWRLVVHHGIPIASSLYRRQGNLEIHEGCPADVTNFVTKVWSNLGWVPDEMFVVDVCESSDDLYILELNSFSCSGWYACNPAAIVSCASEAASRFAASWGQDG